jgi:redox-sensitive bicupin YhaK (pirin superfamily)
MGLQTVSWLLEGEVLHRDSLGSLQVLRPGQLGLMTAGNAIAHAEESPAQHPPVLHGAQLWVALPGSARDRAPAFDFHTGLPVIDGGSWLATVIAGAFGGAQSPATVYSPLVGVDLTLGAGAAAPLPLEADFEYAVLVASGAAEVDGVRVEPGSLLYLGCGRTELSARPEGAARMLLFGGEPFAEQIVMWWNFVARTAEEIAAARHDWMATERFGAVHGFPGERIPAPALPPGTLMPRGRAR